MSKHLNQVLDKFEGHPDVSLRVSGEARELDLTRGGVTVRVTVPDDVLEWFVDVLEGNALVAQDWMDYQGYGDTPQEALAQSMTSDISEFLEKLLQCDLRLVPVKPGQVEAFVKTYLRRDTKLFRKKCILEWGAGGTWEQAVPFPLSD